MINISNKLSYTFSQLGEQRKLIFQFLMTALFIGLGIWFFHHEEAELSKVIDEISNAAVPGVLAGIIITIVYIITHGFMYRSAFAALDENVTIKTGVILFLKRNFISVFLPAGGVSSLAFFTEPIEKSGITKTKIYFASSIYGFIGIVSVVIIAIPVFVYGLLTQNVNGNEWSALILVIILLTALYTVSRNIIRKGNIYRLIKRYYPSVEVYVNDIDRGAIKSKRLLECLIYSLIIEIWGILHLYIAAYALGTSIGLMACATGYIIAVVFMIISP